MKNNVVIKHSLEEYNKKYRNLRHRLLKLSKKDVEDFDKRNPVGIKNYLLNDRKWALIGDTYYEIPKAPRWTWFRNLSAGVQVLTGVLAVGVVATAVAVPLVLLNQSEPEISIDDADLVTWSNKHYDKEGNACLTIKGKDGNQIQSLELSIENYKCIENTDFTYNLTSGDLVVKKACIDEHPGKINITPVFKKETEEDKFYKVYKKASDAFQKSTLVYDKYDIGYKLYGTSHVVKSVSYATTENERSAKITVQGTVDIAGGDFTYYDDEDKGIKAYIKDAITQIGVEKVEYRSDSEKGTCGFTLIKGAMSVPVNFNKDGYVTDGATGVMTYIGNAHKQEVSVNCPYNTGESKYISETSTTLGTREVLNAMFNEQSMTAFDTVECPGFTLGYGTDDCDVRVETIYLDSQGTEATYETDYTVANNKITFTNERSSYTTVVLKATNASGVANLNVNAYKAS